MEPEPHECDLLCQLAEFSPLLTHEQGIEIDKFVNHINLLVRASAPEYTGVYALLTVVFASRYLLSNPNSLTIDDIFAAISRMEYMSDHGWDDLIRFRYLFRLYLPRLRLLLRERMKTYTGDKWIRDEA